MKIYIASPFFNDEQLDLVKSIERSLDSSMTEYFSPRSFGVIKDMTPREKWLRMEEIYDSNISNILSCDTMIAVVDWPDTGTMFELGFAAASPKEVENIITFTSNQKPVNVMLRYAICAHARGIKNLEEIVFSIKQWGYVEDDITNFPEVNT